MMDQEQREFVQAGVDGELDADGRARLEALLAESPEARALHAELESIAAYLDRAPPLPVPDALHARIVAGVRLPRPSGLRSLFGLSQVPAVFRYGLAASAAVLLTAVVYQVGQDLDPTADYERMVGTIARGGPAADGDVLDSFRFDRQAGSGLVQLLEREGVVALEFEMASDAPLQFDVNFSGSGLVFDAFARQDQDLEAVSWSGETLSARARGQQRFVILMRRVEDGPVGAPIGVEISRSGEIIQRGSLDPNQ